ncbi:MULTISPECIES: glycosyltransferase [unclassified Rhizobium]|uniref:glycosyltransferase n=1 Tax=unclassified Rhizobium TaxID=2613769 RepID=UPI001ADC318A|nr:MULTISPECIES: glycosyltransferase [unclassified Rhizobium]MBO9099498.1 glycosyltransferase [Rhizobium sp. L58/93]QXZ87020.1 glycosyltransferase [Rhizobium sp. K1/93]QXZ92946.1 glycosyltransferase [Rhizobium sp. K15/93]
MRILVLSSMFPPNVAGGGEISAFNLASWLLKQGHEIGVVTAAKSETDVLDGEMVGGMKIWRLHMPRPYPIFQQGRNVSKLLKPLWHLQDHLDPRNASMVARVIDEFQPDFCNIHYLTGLGHGILQELGKRDIPVMYVMPDMALSCFRMSMFINNKTCETQCTGCLLSSRYKRRGIRSVRRIGFCSPSRANLEQNARFQPLSDYPMAHILNANKYPLPTIERQDSDKMRFIYVGRIESSKGVTVLLEAAEALSRVRDFSLKIVGAGKEEAEMRDRFGHHDWIEFTGHVPLQTAINHIAASDMLCIPSVWLENSPGVVIQALGMSVPVLGSRVGGIPELVQDDENGMLIEPGNVAAWRKAMEIVLSEPDRVQRYKQNAANRAQEFDQDYLGAKFLRFMEDIREFKVDQHAAPSAR